jgi:hypothetical protein
LEDVSRRKIYASTKALLKKEELAYIGADDRLNSEATCRSLTDGIQEDDIITGGDVVQEKGLRIKGGKVYASNPRVLITNPLLHNEQFLNLGIIAPSTLYAHTQETCSLANTSNETTTSSGRALPSDGQAPKRLPLERYIGCLAQH